LQSPEIIDELFRKAAALYSGHKEIALLLVGAFLTFFFTRCLPWMFQFGSNIGVGALGRVSGRVRRKVALGEYLNWVILQNRDLNLTGIVGAAEKPRLEQVFISVKIHPTERPTEPPPMTVPPMARRQAIAAMRALSFLRPRLAWRSGIRDEGASCAADFSPKLFRARRLLHLRRWADRYHVAGVLSVAAGLVLVIIWPAWSAFCQRSPNTIGSAVAGLVWTVLAAVGVDMVHENHEDEDKDITVLGSIIIAVFGGAVFAAVAVQLAHHEGTRIRDRLRGVSAAALATQPFRPPRRPRATAWGFFFWL
jgi:hypothetical protein